MQGMIRVITKELIDRINFYARKQKEEGLTEAEKQEQQELRQTYVSAIRQRVKGSLDSIKWVNPEEMDSNPCTCGLCSPDEKPRCTH
jgi:uncharacterized protein YnzC (UPF0291/DUF896 family)